MERIESNELKCPPNKSNLTIEEDNLMLTYRELFIRDKNPVWARKKIYEYSCLHSISKTAKEFGCHINTVKKIKKRGENSEFTNRSKAPKNSPYRLDQKIIDRIYESRDDKGMGHNNLKYQYDIPASTSTIYKYLKQKEGCLKPRRKKWKQTKDLREIKKKYKAFEVVQMDGKVLYDIPQFYGFYKKLKIPKLQYTITCQKTGASFIAYADGETMREACTFVVYFLEHLKKFGIDVKNIRFRTDRGSFAIGSARSFKLSLFSKLIRQTYQAKHIINQDKNQNADVERFHGLVEEYFYKQVNLVSIKDFFCKAADAQIWFNYIRKNSGKNWQTPIQILKQDYPNIDPNILSLAPICLNKCSDIYYYKTDPDFKPFSMKSFTIDLLPEKRKIFHSHLKKDNYHYFFGDASKSSFINKSNFKKRSLSYG